MVGALRCNDCGLALDDSTQIQNYLHHRLIRMRSNLRLVPCRHELEWMRGGLFWGGLPPIVAMQLYILRYGQRRSYQF
jgi:hypothetical protein